MRALFLFILVFSFSCGYETSEKVVEPLPNTPAPDDPPVDKPPPKDDPDPINPECPNGKVVFFAEIQSILTDSCAGCHRGYDTYEIAGNPGRFQGFLNRIKLPLGNPRRMPKAPTGPLGEGEKNLLEQYASDGYKENEGCR